MGHVHFRGRIMGMRPAAVRYREYAPCEALRGWVRALFTFSEPGEEEARRRILMDVQFDGSERFCAPAFADAHPCIVFSFEMHFCPDGTWRRDAVLPMGELIGPMTFPGPPSVPGRAESIGAYFRAGAVIPGVPAMELENRAVAFENVWGAEGAQLVEELWGLRSDAERLDRLESALVKRVAAARQVRCTSLDVPKMAKWIVRNGGALSVERLAEVAGLSRRHLTRIFRENIGISPKIYCQLARFRSALAYIRDGKNIGWAQVAVQCGYSDQSHMIAIPALQRLHTGGARSGPMIPPVH